MQWSALRFLEAMMICLVFAGSVPEMIEAGCLYGGCWNMVCLSKVVWIEIFDMTTVGLTNVPWMECWSKWIIFWSLCIFNWSRSNMTLPWRLVLIIGVSIVQWRFPFVKTVSKTVWFQVLAPHLRWTWPSHKLPTTHFWNECVLINFDCKRLGKYFAESWWATGHFKAARDCFFSIRTFATFACYTQANNGTTFAERFDFADPARIEAVEIQSIKRLLGQPKPVEKIFVIICLGLPDDAAWFIHTSMISHLCRKHCSWTRVNHCKDPCAWRNLGGIYRNDVLHFRGWILENAEVNLVWQLDYLNMRPESFWACYSPCRTMLYLLVNGLNHGATRCSAYCRKKRSGMLTSCGSKLNDVDLQYHRQRASNIFHMNRWRLRDRNVWIVKLLRYFESVMSSVACFAGGHRTIYNRHLERLDTHFRKFCRSIVGPPPGTGWTLEWHEILHQWNVRANLFIGRANIKIWSRICCFTYWRLAQHFANLSQECWVRRSLRWCPAGTEQIGFQSYCRYKGLGQWTDAAMNRNLWGQHCESFIEFCTTYTFCFVWSLCSILVGSLHLANIGVQAWPWPLSMEKQTGNNPAHLDPSQQFMGKPRLQQSALKTLSKQILTGGFEAHCYESLPARFGNSILVTSATTGEMQQLVQHWKRPATVVMRNASSHGPYAAFYRIAHGTPLLRAAPEHEKPAGPTPMMEAATPLDRAKAAWRNIRGRGVTQLIDLPKSNKRRHAEVSSDEDKEQPDIQPMAVRQRPFPALQRDGWRISAYGKN